jgi:hypothetical protein
MEWCEDKDVGWPSLVNAVSDGRDAHPTKNPTKACPNVGTMLMCRIPKSRITGLESATPFGVKKLGKAQGFNLERRKHLIFKKIARRLRRKKAESRKQKTENRRQKTKKESYWAQRNPE